MVLVDPGDQTGDRVGAPAGGGEEGIGIIAFRPDGGEYVLTVALFGHGDIADRHELGFDVIGGIAADIRRAGAFARGSASTRARVSTRARIFFIVSDKLLFVFLIFETPCASASDYRTEPRSECSDIS